MLKTYLLLTLLLSIGYLAVQGQSRSINGTVTETNGSPIPGVGVVVKGTTQGSITDEKGNYTFTINGNATVLTFSYVGMKTKEVVLGPGSTYNMIMENEMTDIGEVVITALGIKRDQQSLGYSSQRVSGDDVTKAKTTNFINSLQGKVAGVQITGSSNLGGSSRILLRGVRSITGNNQPLFVVDGVPVNNGNFATTDQIRGAQGYDYGNAIQDINPEDIEDINVLKGSAATALYGTQGANGVIMITTKKGKAAKSKNGKTPLGISMSTGIAWNKVAILPNYQNKYGGGVPRSNEGSIGVFRPSLIDSTAVRPQFGYDGSWGPAMDGQMVRQWDAYYEGLPNYNKATPWQAHPDNIKDFFKTGITYNNNVSISQGNENGNFRLSFTNLSQTGTAENSKLVRNVISFNGSQNISKKWTANVSANYIKATAKGRLQTGYNNLTSNFTQWWQRQLDIDGLRDYLAPDGSQRVWNKRSESDNEPLYWNNPFWVLYQNYETDQRDRVYGNAGLTYKINNWLSVTGNAKTDFYNDNRQERVAIGSVELPKYSEDNIRFNENNYELILTAQKSINENFDVTAFVGANRQDRVTTANLLETQSGLNIPNFYSFENSTGSLKSTANKETLRRNSIFSSVSLGYKRTLFLDLTGRNDWSSALPQNASSYFYPSATASFVFNELIDKKWLSFGKVRAGIASTAIDPVPYVSNKARPLSGQTFLGLGTGIVPNTNNNVNLKPEKTRSFEFGTELIFLNRRASLDFTYYNSLSKDVIFNVSQSGASGYSSSYYNAAKLSNTGIELAIKGVPIRLKNSFEWGVGVNYARNKNMVKELYKDPSGKETESVTLASAPFAVSLQVRPGMEYGQIVGTDYEYTADGKNIIDPNTMAYLPTAELKPLGSIMPKYTGGFNTWFGFKGITLAAQFDFQKGGKIFSLTNTWGKYSGTLAETAEGNIRETGLVLDGVMFTGYDNNGVAQAYGNVANIDTIKAIDHFFLNGGYNIAAADVYDASFLKFRELTITYDLPIRWFKKIPVQGLSFGLSARNIAILHKNIPNLDPEAAVSSNNVQGLEGAQLPTERTIGINLNIKF